MDPQNQDRILGERTVLELYSTNGPIQVGEIDSVDEEHMTEQKTWRPLSQKYDRQQTIHKGWKLSFKGGKIDDSVNSLAQNLQDALINGQQEPTYRATRAIEHYDGTFETYVYDNLKLYGFKEQTDKSDDEIKWDFEGFAPIRTKQ